MIRALVLWLAARSPRFKAAWARYRVAWAKWHLHRVKRQLRQRQERGR